MNPTGLSVIRTKLRDVNVEYSALVRAKGSEDRFVRMHELKVERQALMALMAGFAWHPRGARHCSAAAAVRCAGHLVADWLPQGRDIVGTARELRQETLLEVE